MGEGVADPADNTADQASNSSTDKAALLNSLRIDRQAPAPRPSYRKWVVFAGGFVALVLFLWLVDLPSPQDPVPLRVSTAVAAAQLSTGSSVLDATGYVVARRQATVSSKTTGKVVEVMIEEGMQVNKDQLLARLDDSIPRAQYELAQSQLESSRAGLAELDIALQQAQLDLQRTENLADRSLASQADLDRDSLNVAALNARLERSRKDILVAERAMQVQQQVLDDMQIRAPFSGIVIAKAAQPGEMISPISAGGGFTRTGICTIVDMNSLEIEVDVNESYINRVYPGQPVKASLNAYPDDTYAAEVIAIIPAADRNRATVRVRVRLLQRDERVLPDMGVRVAFLEQASEEQAAASNDAVLVPKHSISDAEGKKFVYVVRANQAERRAVRLGAERGDRVQILTGLSGGERVITHVDEDTINQLSSGANVAFN